MATMHKQSTTKQAKGLAFAAPKLGQLRPVMRRTGPSAHKQGLVTVKQLHRAVVVRAAAEEQGTQSRGGLGYFLKAGLISVTADSSNTLCCCTCSGAGGTRQRSRGRQLGASM